MFTISRAQIPNYLTYFRYAAIIKILLAWLLPAPFGIWLMLVFVLLASISDFLDGFLARQWQVESDLGRLLDPNADKLLIATVLILLACDGIISPVPVVLILARELFVSGLREFMAERRIVIAVTKLAKWKTATQMVSVMLLLLMAVVPSELLYYIAHSLLWIATALTLYTGAHYLIGCLPHIGK